jgi:hypothetical protein
MKIFFILFVILFNDVKPTEDTLDIKTMLQGCWKQQSDKSRFMCIKDDNVKYYFKCKLEESGNLIYKFQGDEESFYENQSMGYNFIREQEFNFDFKLFEITSDKDTIPLGSILYLDPNTLGIAYNAGSVKFIKVQRKTCW